MTILLLGSGGREHAFARKLSESPLCTQLFIAPGNPGTEQHGTNVNLSVMDFDGIRTFCVNNSVDMVMVGPEDPLVAGIYDFFQAHADIAHIQVVGPSKQGAQLEGSKAFAKQFMMRHHIPTAAYREFDHSNFDEGLLYLSEHPLPVVLKADGLAAGKGVVIAYSTAEAQETFTEMIQDQKFGSAGSRVVIEEFLTGIECSVFVLTDGKSGFLLPVAKDYKRIGEGDTGLNTGGMGAISPVPFADATFMKKVQERIIEPTIRGIHQEGIVYKGFVFIGLISVEGNPYVIEYNCRMGDPETEVVLLRLENDLVDVCTRLFSDTLHEVEPAHLSSAAATVMLVSKGYPEAYEKGYPIQRIDTPEGTIVFHAGTKKEKGEIYTNGGRVLAVTAMGDTIQDALTQCYSSAASVQFEGKYYRKDIGWEFPNH